jgi:hypothetical protein
MVLFEGALRAEWESLIALFAKAEWPLEQVLRKGSVPMPANGVSGDVLRAAIPRARTLHAQFFQGYMGADRKALVERFGYDVKMASHVIRLLHMGQDFAATGEVQVWRTRDADLIRSIKQGAFPLMDIRAMAEPILSELATWCDTARAREGADSEAPLGDDTTPKRIAKLPPDGRRAVRGDRF